MLLAAAASLLACQSAKTGVSAASATEFADAEDGLAVGESPVAELESIYFDFDRSTIRSDQRAALGGNASAIQRGAWNRITIAGHCDARGSDEYNLALGERRANAVRQQLVDLGVSPSLLDTVSYGEARPAVQGTDESAWRWNRRAEFLASAQ